MRKIPHVSVLRILYYDGAGVVTSSNQDSGSKVDSTGITTVEMLIIINITHLNITYTVS